MNDNQELLLADTPPNSPLRSRQKTEQQNLLMDLQQHQISTSQNTFCFTQKPPKLDIQTWSCTRAWNDQPNFFWEVESDLQEDSKDDNTGRDFNQEYYLKSSKQSSFPYSNLMRKLEQALQLIQEKQKNMLQEKQKNKAFTLYSSAKHVKSLSAYQQSAEKEIKTQRDNKEDNQGQLKTKQLWKKYSHRRNSVTEPDQSRHFHSKVKAKNPLKLSYIIPKVINEVEQAPRNKRGEKLRTKQEFLASITNWQQRKKIKQQERAQKQQAQSMNGVTFTPQINAKSKLLMKKKGNMLPIYERDIKSKRAGKIQNQLPRHAIKLKK